MKKVISLSMMCLMALSICVVFSCTKDDKESKSGGVSTSGTESNDTYVDLGLPSGTKWSASNEKDASDAQYDFFTYEEAVSQFGNNLPTKVQCEELKTECQWSWNGSGYKVTGPNGNYIVLPAAGGRSCDGNVNYVGSDGYYWSSTPNGSSNAWSLYFLSGSVDMYNGSQCFGRSVRLVQD